MSLHIGNLSSHIHRDELERVFRRFGRCNVRIKDGYGFVVYEFPPDAEKALRALHKRNIFGKPLTLSWSNKQPRSLQRFGRTARSYELRHGGISDRGGDYVKRKVGPNDQPDYRTSATQTDRNSRIPSSADMQGEEMVNRQDEIRDHTNKEHQGYRENFLNERARVRPDPVGNDRWSEHFCDPPNEIGVENGVDFDRYDPHESFDRRNNDENLQKAYSGGTLALQNSQDTVGGGHISNVTLNRRSDARYKETCYKCGAYGHKMRNCPGKNASWKKLNRFDNSHTDDMHRSGRDKGELEKNVSRAWEKLRSSRDAIPGRRLRNDQSSGSGRHEGVTRKGRSAAAKEIDWSPTKERESKKRSRKEIESSKRHGTKKGGRSISSPLHSDYTSRLHSTSHSSKHLQGSHSHSRSKSVSSSLRSGSTSHYSSSKSSKTKSRSLSPTSLSLSVSLGRPLLSSSNKAQLNMKGSSDNATTPESKEVLIEHVQPEEGAIALQGDKCGLKTEAMNDNAVSSSEVDDEMEKDQPLQKDKDDCLIVSNSLHKATKTSTLTQSEEGIIAAGNFSLEQPVLEMECQNSDTFEREYVQVPLKKLDPKAPASSSSSHSTSISAEELSMVLKHYGLDYQNENEKPLSAEAYFGSARLWPWEIIYYRRLKKGPISIENYARRVDQNREFGIVDKYIRGSSGWGE